MERIGSYLDREIRILEQEDFESEHWAPIISNALVLLWLKDASAESIHVLESVTELHPIGVLVCGPDAETAFDVMLRYLSLNPNAPHTMTNMSDESEEECVSRLLQGMWPSEDRFDEWHAYTVIAPKADLPKLRRVIAEHADQ